MAPRITCLHNDGPETLSVAVSIRAVLRCENLPMCSQNRSTGFSRCQCSFGAIPDHLTFVLGEDREHLKK